MFYLLEDNRIVNSGNIRNDLDLSFEIDVFVRDNKIFMGSYDYPGFEKTIKIKKQSVNVIDLIEAGDLINVYTVDIINSFYYERIYQCFTPLKEGNIIMVDYDKAICFCEKNLLAIYKLNTKGDYIKVWEKKVG